MAHRMQSPSESAAAEAEGRAHGGRHPTQSGYVGIALILAIITAIEVWLYYLDVQRTALIVVLLGLSTVKFGLVAGWFMHLKFDNRVLTIFFVAGITLAFIVMLVVLAVQRILFV